MWQPGVRRPRVTFAAHVATMPPSFPIFNGYQLKTCGRPSKSIKKPIEIDIDMHTI